MMVAGANHEGLGGGSMAFCVYPVCPMQLSPIMRPPRVDSVQNIGYQRDSSPMQYPYDPPIHIPAITCLYHRLSSVFSFSTSRLLVVLRRGSLLLQ